MKQVIIVSLTFLAVLLSTKGASACSCLRPPINTEENLMRETATSLREADAVFSGETIEMDGLILKFKVERLWKGDFKDEVSMSTGAIRSGDGFLLSSMCDYKFELGRKYLVFAHGSKDKLKASKCSRTGILDERGKFTNELDRLKLLEAVSQPGKAAATLDLSPLGRQLTTHSTRRLDSFLFMVLSLM
jgi:hypothetical protein